VTKSSEAIWDLLRQEHTFDQFSYDLLRGNSSYFTENAVATYLGFKAQTDLMFRQRRMDADGGGWMLNDTPLIPLPNFSSR